MANIAGNSAPILNDTEYVTKIKNSLDSIDDHDHSTGKGLPVAAGGFAAGSIDNDDVNAAAAIARTKLASGTASHVVVNDGTGVMSSVASISIAQGGTNAASLATGVVKSDGTSLSTEAQLATTRGGTGQNSTATFPTSGVVVTEAASQTLTNKTLTAPAMTDPTVTSGALTLPEIATPSTPASGFGKTYFKSDGKLYQLNDDGTETQVGSGGGSGINYISANPDAESSTTGWATYKDAAAATPVDGTGGSATLTFIRSTSSPLRGTASFLVTTTAANLQGEGASFDFTLASADQAKVMSISFDYNIASGTFVTGDMAVYIYDVTNALVIQPAGYQIQAMGSTLPNKHIATFQTSSNSTSYRLIFHRAVSTSSAMTMKIDNVNLGPQVVQYGAPVTDWVAFTPTGSWTSNTTYVGRRRRVGDSEEFDINLSLTGAPTATQLSVNLPVTIDTAKMSLATGGLGINGVTSILDSGTGWSAGIVAYNGPTSVQVRIINSTAANPAIELETVSNTFPQTFANNDLITMKFSVPVVGYSSTVQMSNDTDTRVVAARIGTSGAPTGTIASTFGSSTTIQFNDVTFDTHSGYVAATGYTVKVPGYYKVYARQAVNHASIAVGAEISIFIFKNGSIHASDTLVCSSASVTEYYPSLFDTKLYQAGDIITIRISSTGTTPVTSSDSFGNCLTVERLSGPSAIAASETVAMHAFKSSAQSINNATDTEITSYDVATIDTHGGFTPSTGRYRVPTPGLYLVATHIIFTSNSTGYRACQTLKNAALYAYGPASVAVTGDSTGAVFTTIMRCVAGDTISNSGYQTSGGALTTRALTNGTAMSITRIGS